MTVKRATVPGDPTSSPLTLERRRLERGKGRWKRLKRRADKGAPKRGWAWLGVSFPPGSFDHGDVTGGRENRGEWE